MLTVVDEEKQKSTRDKILDVAEALMAERGIDSVSLNEIVKAAGQRNASALQYHFGNKAGLVQAIFDKHTPRVEENRKALLAEMTNPNDLEGLTKAVVMPLVNEISNPDGGCNYVRFLARMTQHDLQPDSFADSRHNDAVIEVIHHLRVCFPELSEQVFQYRIVMARNLLLHSLADFCYRLNESTDFSEENLQLFADTLIEATIAMFQNDRGAEPANTETVVAQREAECV